MRDKQHHVWGIDNGLTFHTEFKLRTVIWDWAGDPIPVAISKSVQAFLERPLPVALVELLNSLEIDALKTRARALVERATSLPTQLVVDIRGPWSSPLVHLGHRYCNAPNPYKGSI